MKRLLVQLPYFASTNNYARYFPYPLNLMAIQKSGDILLDLNVKCFKKKKAEVYEILDIAAKVINRQYTKNSFEIILNCGDYPPDADKNELFDYFLEKIDSGNKNVTITGTYAVNKNINKKNVNVRYPLYDWRKVLIPIEMIEKYPTVGDKLKVNLNFSFGCPRKCNYPAYWDQKRRRV